MTDQPTDSAASTFVKRIADMLEETAKQLLNRGALPTAPELAGMSQVEAARLCSSAILLYETAGTPFAKDGATRSARIAKALGDAGIDCDKVVALFKYVPQMRAALTGALS